MNYSCWPKKAKLRLDQGMLFLCFCLPLGALEELYPRKSLRQPSRREASCPEKCVDKLRPHIPSPSQWTHFTLFSPWWLSLFTSVHLFLVGHWPSEFQTSNMAFPMAEMWCDQLAPETFGTECPLNLQDLLRKSNPEAFPGADVFLPESWIPSPYP